MRTAERLAALAVVAALDVACSEAPDRNAAVAYEYAGTYATQFRTGGSGGTWYPNADLQVTGPADPVYLGTTRILSPTFGAGSLSWAFADGNSSAVDITFAAASANAYYWGAGGHTGVLFEGSIQYPGSGPADYRGQLR